MLHCVEAMRGTPPTLRLSSRLRQPAGLAPAPGVLEARSNTNAFSVVYTYASDGCHDHPVWILKYCSPQCCCFYPSAELPNHKSLSVRKECMIPLYLFPLYICFSASFFLSVYFVFFPYVFARVFMSLFWNYSFIFVLSLLLICLILSSYASQSFVCILQLFLCVLHFPPILAFLNLPSRSYSVKRRL